MVANNKINDRVLISYSDLLFEESILQQLLEFSGDIGIPVDLNWEKSYEGRTQHPKSEADNVLIENGKIVRIQKEIENTSNHQMVGEFLGLMILSEKGSKIFVENYNFFFLSRKQNVENYKLIDSSCIRRNKIFLLIV